MNDKLKRLLLDLLYIILVIYLLASGAKLGRHFALLTQKTFQAYYAYGYNAVFLTFIGLVLAIPSLVKELKKDGKWRFDWITFVAIGVPTLYVTISPLLYGSPVGKHLPKIGRLMFAYLFAYSFTPGFVCAIIFGYTLLSVIGKLTIDLDCPSTHTQNRQT